MLQQKLSVWEFNENEIFFFCKIKLMKMFYTSIINVMDVNRIIFWVQNLNVQHLMITMIIVNFALINFFNRVKKLVRIIIQIVF
ncbi:unnamed protein product [Paramecium sonneborni]|uniref:Transmembrane protein n=1 Tax=Paramecium sonneborni TaxID=65129 RepID=A0A8S1PEY6_9CILI|nr:unnamed protein product [Paramecium sonneborni]